MKNMKVMKFVASRFTRDGGSTLSKAFTTEITEKSETTQIQNRKAVDHGGHGEKKRQKAKIKPFRQDEQDRKKT